MYDTILGIDVAKQTFEVALLSENRLRSHRFANSLTGFEQLSAWFNTFNLSPVQACMEATGPYHLALARYLHAAGHTVSVVNPLRIKGFARAQMHRNKTDQVDAVVIARFCEALHPEPWSPPPSEVLVLHCKACCIRFAESFQGHARRAAFLQPSKALSQGLWVLLPLNSCTTRKLVASKYSF